MENQVELDRLLKRNRALVDERNEADHKVRELTKLIAEHHNVIVILMSRLGGNVLITRRQAENANPNVTVLAQNTKTGIRLYTILRKKK